MSMNEDQQHHIKHQLDQQLDRLDQEHTVTHRLAQARAQALTHYKKPSLINKPVLVTALAASVFVALLATRLFDNAANDEMVQEIILTDIELIIQLDLFEQDMEFYYWLEANSGHSG